MPQRIDGMLSHPKMRRSRQTFRDRVGNGRDHGGLFVITSEIEVIAAGFP
jgi:hypothetical protein